MLLEATELTCKQKDKYIPKQVAVREVEVLSLGIVILS